jgi:hypothetical protein
VWNGSLRMADKQLQQIVERAVAQVLERQLPKLQAELVERVLAELPVSSSASTPAPSHSPSQGNLVQAVSSIHAGTTQKEILRALLDAGSAHAARLALFVVKGGNASGWQGRGFGDDESIKDFSLDMTAGPVAHSYQSRRVAPANSAEMDGRFTQRFGGPDNEQILVLPLVLKDKVAALLYADGGSDGLLDAAALELLVLATSSWLEVASLRKQTQKDTGETAVASAPQAPPPPQAQTVSSFSDPFASHSPRHIAPKTPEPEPEPSVEVVEVVHAASASAAASAAPATAADPFAGMSPEDADTHRKAQRFARLLVDEIKLYNQAKVAEGRRHKDLYDRLKEDIEKSRATYSKRYGTTVAASGDYFQKEVVRSLAEDDAGVMGGNFKK